MHIEPTPRLATHTKTRHHRKEEEDMCPETSAASNPDLRLNHLTVEWQPALLQNCSSSPIAFSHAMMSAICSAGQQLHPALRYLQHLHSSYPPSMLSSTPSNSSMWHAITPRPHTHSSGPSLPYIHTPPSIHNKVEFTVWWCASA